jgi:aryl-alcohol dehydrogenase-like predicted oxidoreductase
MPPRGRQALLLVSVAVLLLASPPPAEGRGQPRHHPSQPHLRFAFSASLHQLGADPDATQIQSSSISPELPQTLPVSEGVARAHTLVYVGQALTKSS